MMYDDDDEMLETDDESLEIDDESLEKDNEMLEAYNESLQDGKSQKTDKQRNNENNAKNVRNAAEVAIASKNPYAMAAGGAVKAADKISGGKASEAIGKKLTRVNNHMPFGRRIQRSSNQLAESGASDSIGSAAAMKNNGVSQTTTDASSNGNSDNKVVIVKALMNPITRRIILIGVPILLGLIIILAVIAAISDDSGSGIAYGGYYHIPCDEITVVFTDKQNGYAVTGTETYPLEEYVAGVVVGEVAYLGSHELDKAFAVAARTYLAANVDSSTCTIESSDRYQVFRTEKSESATLAAQETKGKVLLLDGNLYSSIQYDAFACIDKDENYYTISQANQKVPKTWIESKINPNSKPEWFICNGKENLQNHHGNGMSQFGGLYLATEHNYTYEEILAYYKGYNVTISSSSYNGANFDLKNTSGAKNTLRTPISDFLASNGSSLEEFNQYINNSVETSGYGTREGVVAAAVSMVNFLYDNFDTKLPYYWGGGHQSEWERNYGILSSVGTYQQSPQKPSGAYDYYYSFDCSGFVSWVVRNGGYNFSTRTAANFINSFGDDSCPLASSGCTGIPGDIIASSGHVQIIVGVNEEKNTYYIAESANGVTISEKSMHFGSSNYLLHMDNYYNNSQNVDNVRIR